MQGNRADTPVELGPGRLRAILRHACAVARGLAQAQGQRQFYTLAQVQSQVAACGVEGVAIAWVFAAFVTRVDFEAFFAVR